jgi:ribonuclease P protein component
VDGKSCVVDGSRDGPDWPFSQLLPQKPIFRGSSGNTLGRFQRLRRPGEFAEIRRVGKKLGNEFLLLRALDTGTGTTRLGFSVGKRLGNAVIRNLVKRRLREILRQREIGKGWDIVVSARPLAAKASYRALANAIEELLCKADIPMAK